MQERESKANKRINLTQKISAHIVGVETARRLIRSPNISGGYTDLWERKRLDLTVEALIYDNEKLHPLFTPEELAICRKRLRQYEYIAP